MIVTDTVLDLVYRRSHMMQQEYTTQDRDSPIRKDESVIIGDNREHLIKIHVATTSTW